MLDPLYLCVGLGPSWMLLDGVFTQLALLDRSAPEGLALATYLGTAAALTNSLVVPAFYAAQRSLQWPHHRWVVLATAAQCLSALLAALFWRWNAFGVSFPIYAVVTIAMVGGNMQQLATLPWISEAAPDRIVDVMAGGNAGAVVGAALAIAQQTALKGVPFWSEPTAFFCLMALLLAGAGAALYVVLKRHATENAQGHIRLAASDVSAETAHEALFDADVAEAAENPLRADSPREDDAEGPPKPGPEPIAPESVPTARWRLLLRRLDMPLVAGGSSAAGVAARRECYALTAAYSWLQIVCWCLLRSALPYLFAAARPRNRAAKDGASYLSLAINISLLTCFVGAAFAGRHTAEASKKFNVSGVTTLTTGAFLGIVAVAAAAKAARVKTSRAPVIALIAGVALVRFLDGYYSPLLYSRIAAASGSVEVVQWAGAVAIVAAVLAIWATLIFVV
ncbi:hypothetical protein M885DRAFT_566629 [Pelagophyceae sp. CCMP2097]|nr:hypothetical protein M885DRAFT_566629 [Pelagophyceae sp. CCMP2097]